MQLDEEYEGAEEEEAAKTDGAIQKRDSRGLFKEQSRVSILLYNIPNLYKSCYPLAMELMSVRCLELS